MKYSSYAGTSRGNTNPEETHVWTVEANGEGCGLDGCTRNNCNHTVFMWSGGEYSKNHTWIAADDDATFSLEKLR